MPGFFDLMKYARTGIASPDMTGFDKMRARAAFGGYSVSTITGVPPISFKSDGSPLTAWSIAGNMVQTGTPTPDAPIMPEFVGVRTWNLNSAVTVAYGTQRNAYYADISIDADKMATLIREINAINGDKYLNFAVDNAAFTPNLYISFSGGTPARDLRTPPFKINAGETVSTLIFRGRSDSADYAGVTITASEFMLNTGATALPFEPYGYAIQISCAGQTVPVYLGQTVTTRRVRKMVLDGTESITRQSINQYGVANFVIPSTDRDTTTRSILCTHYVEQDTIISDTKNDGIFNGSSIFIRDTSNTTATDFKAYIAQQYANGTPVTVWYVLSEPETGIVNEPLCKIGDYADELHSTDADVTIPTAKGANVLTVDTTLQPSAVSVTGNIKAI